MNCVRINEAETVIESFWDSGESYRDHQKYFRMKPYRITYADGVSADVYAGWHAVVVEINKAVTDAPCVTMRRQCDIDLSGYDLMRINLELNEAVRCEVSGTIDGTETKIMDFYGKNVRYEYDGKICGKRLSAIGISFYCNEPIASRTEMYWLGLVNSEKEEIMKRTPIGMDTQWEGCFEEAPEIDLTTEVFLDRKELPALRKKLASAAFVPIMDQLREEAKETMKLVPERYIGDYYRNGNKQVARPYEYGSPETALLMKRLAFVGLVDRDTEMLRMACRMALSLASCKSWEESFMSHFPGSTWSRRSFSVSDCSVAIAIVLDFAGSLLTWHGKNILYQALIMKGLPRLEADFRSVDYILHCNQGIVFSYGRVATLCTLGKQFPKYQSLLADAKQDLFDNLEEYITPDGGTLEGPSYWHYTITLSIPSFMILARQEKKPLHEVVPRSVIRSERYGLASLSDAEEWTLLPINDGGLHLRLDRLVVGMYVLVSDNPTWKKLYQKSLSQEVILRSRDPVSALILSPAECDGGGDAETERLINISDAGQTTVRYPLANGKTVRLHAVSGETYFSHSHEDKGSFLLEVGNTAALIDRGYGHDGKNISIAEYHNLFCPLGDGGEALHQKRCHTGVGGKVLRASLDGERFCYETDVTEAWEDGIYKRALRKIEMECGERIVITDSVCYETPHDGMFVLNTYGEIERLSPTKFTVSCGQVTLTVTTENWTPTAWEIAPRGVDDDGASVNRLALFTGKRDEAELVTVIRVNRE